MIPGWHVEKISFVEKIDVIWDSIIHLQECPTYLVTPWSTSQLHEHNTAQTNAWRSESKINNEKENSRVRIGRITFTAEASNLEIGRYSCNPKTRSGFLHQEWRITQKILAIHLYCGLRTKSILYCRSWTRSKRKKEKEVVRVMYTLVQMEEKLFPPWRVYNLSPTMGGLQCVSTTMPAMLKKLRKVNHQIQWRLEKNAKDWFYLSATQKRILADIVCAIIMYQSLRWKNALQKLSKKIEKTIVRKTTYVSKAPDGTLRSTRGHKSSDVSSMLSGTRE